jgi:hypothetical protein
MGINAILKSLGVGTHTATIVVGNPQKSSIERKRGRIERLTASIEKLESREKKSRLVKEKLARLQAELEFLQDALGE